MPDEIPDEMTPEQKAKDEQAEAQIKELVTQVTETNKRLDDVYDEKLREIEAERKMLPKDEKEVEAHKAKVQVLQEKYAALKAKISASRRSGKDPIIAEFKSRTIPSKIMLANVTKEQKAFEDVEASIKDCLLEVEEADKEEILNIKKEIEVKFAEEMQKVRDEIKASHAVPKAVEVGQTLKTANTN